MIEIAHRYTKKVLHRVDADTLSGANLANAILMCAELSSANLDHADLTGAHLNGVGNA